MAQAPPPPSFLPYMVGLNLLDLRKLFNDPISHDLVWATNVTKLPLDIPKFEGKAGEDPINHVLSFHLVCSSNNVIEDSIHLYIF